MGFPVIRPRRLRDASLVRSMVRETRLSLDQLVYPLFVAEGKNVREPIASMPGQFRLSLDKLLIEAERMATLGVPALMLFGIPAAKDPQGSGAYADDGVVQQAMRALREAKLPLVVIGDVCLCEYTSHGHCGLIADNRIDNDATLDLLARTAVSQARAGADIIAPSDMMDGRVRAIRAALDAAGFVHTPIMSYAVKYASAFYGPFRDAAGSAPAFGDRRTHQMDPANGREALREAALDVEEGADIVMVKPALAYLDVIRAVRERVDVPVAAYAVSGEYAMIEAAAANGWLDRDRMIYECLTAVARAGADVILTYHAPRAAELMAAGDWPPG
ncbi:MAG: porphobilinogen synthase [Myxococcales bacterium]|nr:MAG: porphobilinogen synthase [Myxococcales bacterium]